jgi:hypothetical protein
MFRVLAHGNRVLPGQRAGGIRMNWNIAKVEA